MYKLILSIFILISSLCTTPLALAQIPDHVLKPYKTYKTALEAGDQKKAGRAAFSAWKRAEKTMGDSKTTGDLALNYAVLNPKIMRFGAFKTRSKAYLRAIELGGLHRDDTANIILDRYLDYLSYLTKTQVIRTQPNQSISPLIVKHLPMMESALDKLARRGSIQEIIMETTRTAYLKSERQYKKAILSGTRALNLIDTLPERHERIPYARLRWDMGQSYYKLNRYLEAGLILQDNFQNKSSADKPSAIDLKSEGL